jgi:hypothetical protein
MRPESRVLSDERKRGFHSMRSVKSALMRKRPASCWLMTARTWSTVQISVVVGIVGST